MERFQSLVGKAGGSSSLLPALMISLALHFLLLWPAALPRMGMETGQAPLLATLRAEAKKRQQSIETYAAHGKDEEVENLKK